MTDGAEDAELNSPPLLDQILAGFNAAETAAEEVVEQILDEGANQLYQAYLERKSFNFAAEAFSNLLISEMEMCFVRHDEGELSSAPRDSKQSLPAEEALLCICGTTFVQDAPFCRKCGRRREEVLKAVAPAAAEEVNPLPAAEQAAEAAPGERAAPAAEEQLPPEDEASAEASAEAPPPAEPGFGSIWSLEAEPQRCRIDTWARACVPVRRKLVRPKSRTVDEQKKMKGRAPKLSQPSVSSRSPSRLQNGLQMAPEPGLEMMQKVKSSAREQIPLEEKVDHDEEEAALREMKEREAKRRKDEEHRLQRKAADEAEEAARLAQVKDQMKNKPYTYDSQGNIIWVQALQAEKLPSASPAPSYTLRREHTAMLEETPRDRKAVQGARKKDQKKVEKVKSIKEAEFVDTFKKFASQQPAMIEAMTLAPGVQLSERGNTKKGDEHSSSKDKRLMTRRDYEELVQSGKNPAGYPDAEGGRSEAQTPGNATPAEGGSVAPSGGPSRVGSTQALKPEAVDGATSAGGSLRDAGDMSRNDVVGGMRVVRSTDLAMAPHPPSTSRSEQPLPPPNIRRVQMKRDALGYALSTRERIPTGTGSRFPNCAAAPPLGATMGHGLLPEGKKHEEYYFPTVAPGYGGSDIGEDFGSVAPSGLPSGAPSVAASLLPSPRSFGDRSDAERAELQGQIVNKNPDLIKQLFRR